MPFAKGSVVHRMRRKRISRTCGVCAGELCDKVGKVRPTNARVTRQATREEELSACVCLGTLGEDNLLHIFNFLCLRDLMNVSRTCKKFHKLSHTKCLWTSVSLRSTSISSWLGLVTLFNTFSTIRLDLTWMNRPSHSRIFWIIRILPALSLVKCLRQLHFVAGVLPADILEEVPKFLPRLETLVVQRIVCSSYPQNQHLQETPAVLDLGKFCSMTNLQELQLKGVCGIRSPTFSFSRGLSTLSRLTSLRVLSLTTLQDVPANKFDFLPSLVHLRTLRLGNCTHWDMEVYKNLGQLTGLEYLYMENSGASPDICVALGNLTRLKVVELVIFILPADLSIILPSMPLLHTVVLVPHMEDEMVEVNSNCLSIIQSLRSCSQLRKLRWGVITHHRHLSHTDDDTESIPVPRGRVSWNATNQQPWQAGLGDGKNPNRSAKGSNLSKNTDQKNGSRSFTHSMKLRSSNTSDTGSGRVDKKVEPTDDRNVANSNTSGSRSKEVSSVSRPHHRGRDDDVSCSTSDDDWEVLVSVNQLNRVLKPLFPTADVSVSRIYVAEQ